MKVRKVKDLKKTLQLKGFVLDPTKEHHNFYYLNINGKKHSVYTYFSHGIKDYGIPLMAQIKKQLKFKDIQKAEDFFDCPLSAVDYLNMLKENGDL